MGAGSSVGYVIPEEKQYELFQEMKNAYEQHYGAGTGSEQAVKSAIKADSSARDYRVGDVVIGDDGSELVVIEKVANKLVLNRQGSSVEEILDKEEINLLRCGLEYEVGDKVQVKPEGSALYFVGHVRVVHSDGTMDVEMVGDDPDDLETNVKPDNCKKLLSHRLIENAASDLEGIPEGPFEISGEFKETSGRSNSVRPSRRQSMRGEEDVLASQSHEQL